MTTAQWELSAYYAILAVSALSCVLQSRVVWRLWGDLGAARRSGRADRIFLSRTTLLSELSPLCLHFAFFVVLGFPLLVTHWSWLAQVMGAAESTRAARRAAAAAAAAGVGPVATPLPLFAVEAVAALCIPLLLLGHTYVAGRRRRALRELVARLPAEAGA